MRTTFTINFYCRESCKSKKTGMAPIECVIIVNGQRTSFQLPRKMAPADFKDAMNGKSMNDTKKFCQAVETKIYKIQSELELNEQPISATIIKDIYQNGMRKTSYTIGEMIDVGLKLKEVEDVDVRTYQKYSLVADRFLALIGKNRNNEASSVTNEDILKYKALLSRTYASTYVSRQLRIVKYFFTTAFNSGRIKSNPFLTMKIGKGKVKEEIRYLTYDEVQQLKACKITNERLEKVRDYFLFSCFTGLPHTDIAALEPSDVKRNEEGNLYIKKKRVKSGIEYLTILYEDAATIWEEYDGEIPVISLTKTNLYLKELGKLAGLSKELTTYYGRHTFAIYALNTLHLEPIVVCRMMGHTSVKQTEEYMKVLDNTVFKTKAPTEKPQKPKYDTVGKRFRKIVWGD